MILFVKKNDIIHECSIPRTPQQNDLAERKNRTYLEMINVLLLHFELSFNLWEGSLPATCHIFSRILMKKIRLLYINCGNKGNLI